MNRQEILALGVGLLLILGVVGIANTTDTVSIVDSPSEESLSDSPESADTEGNGAANVTVSAVQAMRTAQNETGRTAVGTQLKQVGNATDLGRPVQAYEVDVLSTNHTHEVVYVYASNGSVYETASVENESTDLGRLLNNEDEVPDERLNVTAIRSGVEAIELAWNETDRERTVTEVALVSENESLVYEVNLVTTEGARTTVIVAAHPSDGGVLAVGTGDEDSGTTTD